MTTNLEDRVAGCGWPAIERELDARGAALLPGLLDARERAALRVSYVERGLFRSRVVMERHNYGRGEYQYFSYPLPSLVQALRDSLYRRLAPTASRWSQRLGRAEKLPGAGQAGLLSRGHAPRGQRNPQRRAPHARHHFPRRCLAGSCA